MRRVMEEHSRKRHEVSGYDFVYSPHITKSELFEISGHLDWFAESMYPPMELDGGTKYYLKPMNCPFHMLIYKANQRSYRDLPLRYFEFGSVYRYELSGVVHGLTRVRGMTQDDAHIFCTREQIGEELTRTLQFVLDLLRDFGLNDFYLELSTRPPGKAVGTDEEWLEAEATLESVADRRRAGARDGPRRRRLLRTEDLGAGARRHRSHAPAVDGAVRLPDCPSASTRPTSRPTTRSARTDHDPPGALRLGGAIPGHTHRALRRQHADVAAPRTGTRARRCATTTTSTRSTSPRPCALDGLRVSVEAASEPLGARIRKAKLEKIPYILVVGDDDVEKGTVGVNARGSNDPERGVSVAEFRDRLVEEIAVHGSPEDE